MEFARLPSAWGFRGESRKTVIELFLEFLLEIVVQVTGEVLFEFVVGLGWDSLSGARDSRHDESRGWTDVACFLIGCLAGVASVLIVGRRLTPYSLLPGVSLVLAPVGTGFIMSRLGDSWDQRGRRRPVLFSFVSGAIFAFGMALVRFVYIELQWRLF